MRAMDGRALMDLRLRGSVALVTGAAGGIGVATVRLLVREGVRVAALDQDAAGLTALEELGSEAVLPIATDITDERQVERAVDRTIDRFGRLDILVSAAGLSGPVGTLLSDISLAEWSSVQQVNVTGAFLVLRAAVPALRRSTAACVVLVASDSAFVSAPGMVPYGVSKAAVLQLARAAAVDLAPDGIRVTAVCPSIVDTPMSRGDLGLPTGFAAEAYPVQTADDVAAQIAFLASPVAHGVNATGLVSDFGYSARSTYPA